LQCNSLFSMAFCGVPELAAWRLCGIFAYTKG